MTEPPLALSQTGLAMELRSVNMDERLITGVVQPYDETSYVTGDPAGERMIRGVFAKSIRQRANRIPLFEGHPPRPHVTNLGHSQSWTDDVHGLGAIFKVRAGERGDQALEDAREEGYGGLSVEFAPLVMTRGDDGAREVREARLLAVALVGVPAYDGSRILAVRQATAIPDLFPPRPEVDLTPIPATWLYDSPR